MAHARIIGTEIEWGAVVQTQEEGPGEAPEAHTASGILKRYRNPDLPHVGSYYANGARIYCDSGNHLEYSTPETTGLADLVAAEIAGERLTQQMFEQAARQLDTTRRLFHNFAVYKRVIDEFETSWGYHESYSCRRDILHGETTHLSKDVLTLYAAHLATRNLYAGAGAVRRNGTYAIAQKALDVSCAYATGTTGRNKPVVNLRHEPLADSGRWLRVHATSGDPHMSPWSLMMQVGTTSLVLKLIEQGVTNDRLAIRDIDLPAVMRQVATDLTMRETVRMEDDAQVWPREIQTTLYEMASALPNHLLTADDHWVLSEWQQACEDLKNDPMRLKDRAEWAAKRWFLENAMAKKATGWNDKAMRALDRRWTSLGEASIGLRWRDKHWGKWLPPEALIQERMLYPPESTRAQMRGAFIRAFHDYNPAMIQADWDHLRCDKIAIDMPNPYQTTHPKLETLLAKLTPASKAS